MTRKLLMTIAVLIAVIPFLGIPSAVQTIITTSLALFSAVTLYFSRKPRMRQNNTSVVSSPYMPSVQAAPLHEVDVMHDHAAHVIVNSSGKESAGQAEEKARAEGLHPLVHDLPVHPIAPRARRKKVAPADEAAHSIAVVEDAPLPFHEAPSLPLGVSAVARPLRARRPKIEKSILAEEAPIRPADTVIPARELALEHTVLYHSEH